MQDQDEAEHVRNHRTKLVCEVEKALQRAFGDEGARANPMVTSATRPEYGDYQCNAALALAKPLKSKPRSVAEKLTAELQISEWCEPPEIVGPGFINIRLKPVFVIEELQAIFRDSERLGVARRTQPRRIIVDFSSPNIAKEMHVGHLRSTVIGDSISNILEFLGHDVLRYNHVGDWGTQFGMLIAYLKDKHPEVLTSPTRASSIDLGDLVEFYKAAKVRSDQEEEFRARSRQEVVDLQSGQAASLQAWKMLCELSQEGFQRIYDMLGIRITVRGESFYNHLLPAIVTDLESEKLLAEHDGARVVFCDGYTTREGTPQAFVVQKSDGAFLYATTDIAAARYRAQVEKADRILYVTDVGQATHFDQVFQIVRKAHFVPEHVQLEHVPFGLVLGENGKKLKTREGDTVKLKDLLDEAVRTARTDLIKRAEEGRQALPDDLERTAKVIGIGAVKYADLSLNRESDYRFSFTKMLSLSGNTAPYMLYAYARIQSLLRKLGAQQFTTASDVKVQLVEPAELSLAKQVIRLTEQLQRVEEELYPHLLCEYLYDLSQKFNKFYEECPVANADSIELQQSRLVLCILTARVLRLGLNLLGIEILERM